MYSPKEDTAEVIKRYFHENYQQCINGVVLNREQYIQHVLAQKKNLHHFHMAYLDHLEGDNELFTIYCVESGDDTSELVRAEVIIYVRFVEHQILIMHGQVRLIEGDMTLVDMAG